MPPRFATWFVVLVLADVLAWALTLHATFTYHAGRGDPTVMSLGDLLGWIVSVGLLVIVVLMAGARIRRRRDGRRLASWMGEADR